MLSYSLDIDDFSDEDYYLIGIHTPLEDYRLAYFLNKYIHVNFKKAAFDIDVKKINIEASFTVFEHVHEEMEHNFFLFSNACEVQEDLPNLGFFEAVAKKMYLVPEKKNIDYFIKIEGVYEDVFVENFLEEIRKITQVTTSYIIETNTLKSKDFLIF